MQGFHIIPYLKGILYISKIRNIQPHTEVEFLQNESDILILKFDSSYICWQGENIAKMYSNSVMPYKIDSFMHKWDEIKLSSPPSQH